MAQDINTFGLVARLAADPELRSLNSGTSICKLRVAFNTSRKNGDQWEDVGNFIDVKVWGAQGETAARYLSKGKRVALQGRITVEEWEADGGGKRSKVVLVADRVQFIEPKPADGGNGNAGDYAVAQSSSGGGDIDDDIPF